METNTKMANPLPSRVSGAYSCPITFYQFLRNRSLGLRPKLGHNDHTNLKLYSNFSHHANFNGTPSSYGGIFNLEFSLNGKLLVAACERRQVLIFDAANQKLIKEMWDAHLSSVNCIRFLDDKTFATCSDDNSIKLWDIRTLRTATRTLHGHSNWVKNIEYSEQDHVMVTSAFDGSIYAWNLRSPTENSMLCDRVFLMNGLMRTKLSPDGSKMIISTTSGYMIIVHDLNLTTLESDLKLFRPNIYRLMQLSGQNFPVGTFNYLFHPSRRRNRIEFIDDFPNDAEVISSLQIHPHGWSALTRNLSGDENEEWTSVHDIQKRDPKDYEDAFSYIEENLDEEDDESEERQRAPTDLWMGYIAVDERNMPLDSDSVPRMDILNSGLIGRHNYNYGHQTPEQRNKVVTNLPRLTHFVKEKNVGKGYIKELCFSSDGRIICSPFYNGIRLLGFNNQFQELSYCVPDHPCELTTLLELNDFHRHVVVSCKFNPVYLQLASGCLGSDIKWYQPVL